MKISRGVVLGVLLCTMGPVVAPAADGIGRDHARAVVNLIFNALDCDVDGVVDPGEVDEHFAQLWHPIDRDRSRTLSPREYALTHHEVAEPIAQALFADADANGDGDVDFREFNAHIKRLIIVIDNDGDLEISRADVGLKPWPMPKARRFTFARRLPGDS